MADFSHVHPGTPTTEHNMPFVPGFLIEGGKLVFLSGMGPLPIYHKHPHDPVEEAKWYEGDISATSAGKPSRTFELIMKAAGGDLSHVVKLTHYLVDVFRDQDVLNEITWEIWGHDNMPPRTLVEIPSLAHKDMLLEIDATSVIPTKVERHPSKKSSFVGAPGPEQGARRTYCGDAFGRYPPPRNCHHAFGVRRLPKPSPSSSFSIKRRKPVPIKRRNSRADHFLKSLL